ALSGVGDDAKNRHNQSTPESPNVNLVTVHLGNINHVEGDDRKVPQLDDLGGVVKIALEVEGVHDNHDQGRGGQFSQTVQQHVARDLLVEGLRAEAVSAGQVEHACIQAGGLAKQ